jgi:hypothetical protein
MLLNVLLEAPIMEPLGELLLAVRLSAKLFSSYEP